jgi:hypothetical protein
MADYHPLIARAVAGLDRNSVEARRVVYDRARNALVAQLRAIQPPLEESEITRERLELEEAIRKVEGEETLKAGSAPSEPAAGDSMRGGPPAASSLPRRETARTASPPRRPPPLPGIERTTIDAAGSPDPASPAAPRPRPASERSSLTSEALKGYRDVVPDKGRSGGAEPPPPPPPFTPSPREPARESFRPSREGAGQQRREPPTGRPSGMRDAGPYEPAPMGRASGEERGPLPQLEDHSQATRFERGELRGSQDGWRDVHEPVNPETFDFSGPAVDDQEVHRPRRSYWGLISIVIALLLICGIGAGAYYAVSRPGGLTAMFGSREQAAAPAQREAAVPTRGKNTDRVGGPNQPQQQQQQQQPQQQAGQPPRAGTASTPAAPVAQRVVLYEDEPDNPQGKQYVGSAIWRTEMVSPGPGLAPEMAVRADVEIPDRKITMTWSLRRNTDQNLPASHTIEIMFNLPADFPHGGIANVPGIMMKQAEATRGVALAGLAVKVTNGYFLIGLSAVETDLQRNIQLLKERAWFDIPVLYNDNRRAILALEKGNPGERAFAEAFSTWVQ